MNNLISKISEKAKQKQIIIATHSSFVMNKLGIESVILFNRGKSTKLSQLTPDTRDYFMKLPGHDTLRLILSKKAILVEGASDELIVQKAFIKKYGAKPLEKGVDIISVQSLAFKRFLEIGVLLDLEIRVVTDNDGNVAKLESKYAAYRALKRIRICYDSDEKYNTLEPQLLKANSLDVLNKVIEKNFANDDDLLEYMESNKTDCALKIFNSGIDINFPGYINDAIN
jgi:predicted ATP-dependent endonuclease of OLD family